MKKIYCNVIIACFACIGLLNSKITYASETQDNMLDSTDSLTICVEEPSMTSQELLPVIERFQELYPEIELEIIELPTLYDDSYLSLRQAEVERVKTEVMNGGGPDLFILYVGTQVEQNGSATMFPDLEKTARAGVFADLEELIEADGAIDMEDYYSFVQSAGTIGGTFSVFPLNFYINNLNITTTTSLKESGINIEKANSSTKAYAEEIDRCLTEQQRFDAADVSYENVSYGLLDYDTGEVHLGDEEKWYFERSKEAEERYLMDDRSSETTDQRKERRITELMEGKIPLVKTSLGYYGAIEYAGYMAAEGQDAAFWLIPDENGSCHAEISSYAAINADSTNKGNAMEFLKILVSEEMQGQGYYPCSCYLPVLKGKEILHSVIQATDEKYGFSLKLPWEELSDETLESLVEEFERITAGRLMASQVKYIPINGEKIFFDYYIEYIEGSLTYEEFSEIVKEGLEFYWAE